MYVAYSNSASQGSHHRYITDSKPIRGLSKTTVRFIAAVILLVVVFSFGALIQVHAVSGNTVHHVKEPVHLVVERGDTLWAIASEHLPEGKNVRSYIEQIKKTNGLQSSQLVAGQVLQLP